MHKFLSLIFAVRYIDILNFFISNIYFRLYVNVQVKMSRKQIILITQSSVSVFQPCANQACRVIWYSESADQASFGGKLNRWSSEMFYFHLIVVINLFTLVRCGDSSLHRSRSVQSPHCEFAERPLDGSKHKAATIIDSFLIQNYLL